MVPWIQLDLLLGSHQQQQVVLVRGLQQVENFMLLNGNILL